MTSVPCPTILSSQLAGSVFNFHDHTLMDSQIALATAQQVAEASPSCFLAPSSIALVLWHSKACMIRHDQSTTLSPGTNATHMQTTHCGHTVSLPVISHVLFKTCRQCTQTAVGYLKSVLVWHPAWHCRSDRHRRNKYQSWSAKMLT